MNYEPLAKTLFVVYMICMPIMMINMLIAMMGNTYSTVIAQAEKAWRQQVLLAHCWSVRTESIHAYFISVRSNCDGVGAIAETDQSSAMSNGVLHQTE